MKCEAIVEQATMSKETGKFLGYERTVCKNEAKVHVRRAFSGIESDLCGVHARPYLRDELGRFKVQGLATRSA